MELYERFVAIQEDTNKIRAERNETAKAMKKKLEKEERDRLITHGKLLKDKLEGMEATLRHLETDLQREGQRIPNLTHPEVPKGGEENAALLSEVRPAAPARSSPQRRRGLPSVVGSPHTLTFLHAPSFPGGCTT